MKVNYAHLCDYALLAVDGKCSMMGVLTSMIVKSIPATRLQTFLVFEMELDYAEVGKPFPLRIECVDEDGNTLLKMETSMGFQGPAKIGDHPKVANILRLPPIKFTRVGQHDLNIFLGADTSPKYRVEFDVIRRTPPQSPPIKGKPPLPLPPGK